MVIHVSSYPPLSQVTQLENDTVYFQVILEDERQSPATQWEVALWHSAIDGEWEETLMLPIAETDWSRCLQIVDESCSRLYFDTTLTIADHLEFTVKFREGLDRPWRWARQETSATDGLVVINVETYSYENHSDLSQVIHGLNKDLLVKTVASQTPRTQLWTIEATVDESRGDRSTCVDVELGNPWGRFLRYFALVRHGPPWLGPRHGKTKFALDKDALMCSFLSPDGKHLVLLGMSGLNNVITLLRSSNHGPVLLHIRNDNERNSHGLVLAAVGDNLESALAAVVYHARNVVSVAALPDERASELQRLSGDVKPEWIENWYDGLGYCTWNALGQRLTEEKLLDAVDSLAQNNINVTTFIIDDNWQDIDYSGPDQYQHGWNKFEAEPKAFPGGLKDTVSRIRSKHTSIQNVAVWHALLGYWGGISAAGDLAKTYKTIRLDRDSSGQGGSMAVIAEEDVQRFYDDFYRFLVSCGIDGVKTDVQYMIDTWVSAKHRRELTNTYLDAWMISALRHFSVKAISCMSQAPSILFHQQLRRNRPVMLARNSDDFYPDVPASHPWHVWANAYNTLFTQHLNILPDWDMFQTHHELAGFHAAARCVSGGPIYITDVPGQHNLDLIHQITAITPQGKTVILRPSVLGRALDHYISYDEDSILKVGCYHGRAVTGTPMVGMFNTRERRLTEIVPLSRFSGVVSSAKYVLRAHTSGRVSSVLEPESAAAHLTVSLDVRGYDIFTAYPVARFESETNGTIFTANLGLVGKMTGAAAITATQSELLPTGKVYLVLRLKALGTLGLFISNLPEMSVERDFMVMIQNQPIPLHTVAVDTSDTHVLAVDVEAAWKEMALKPGWSNEVEVKLWFDIEHP